MRKVIFLLTLVFTLSFSCVAFASYPDHLDGNPNFILCNGKMGTGYYVDRSSLNVQRYAPPTYIIAVNVVGVPDADMGKTDISDVYSYSFLYKYDERRMFIAGDGQDYDWRYLDPRASYAETGIVMPAGEMAFYLAYNLRFYGDKVSYGDSFYNKI